ncbi:MAG: hypothetical protein J6R95_02105, partial [Bacteroidales bacterium]|nr:hypothetical protein [Bacteroidales bacterium]
MMKLRVYISIFFLSTMALLQAKEEVMQPIFGDSYNIVWNSQSANSSESMPCGGGDVGMNVWVEEGDLLVYFSRSGTFDENNTMLKLGRLRIQMDKPLDKEDFMQVLRLPQGDVLIQSGRGDDYVEILLWADVFKPVIHIEVDAVKAHKLKASYESWRHEDRTLRKNESFGNSYTWAPPKALQIKADKIAAKSGRVYFRHQNQAETIFDVTVAQQGMEAVKDSLDNPLAGLTFGGMLYGRGFCFNDTLRGRYQQSDYKAWQLQSWRKRRHHRLYVLMHNEQYATTLSDKQIEKSWMATLKQLKSNINDKKDKHANLAWWQEYWNRSYICINPFTPIHQMDSAAYEAWKVGRNYQLFRYQLACNAYGSYPTKFNGGLFTFDPGFVNEKRAFSPDFRNWGGGTFTAQNQRLVYFPMLKSGDVDMMRTQFDYYKNLLNNTQWRSRHYWHHDGACFTEQMENFGLPNPSEYSWKRPADFDPGMEYNKWLEYQWDTVLEFCFMILEAKRYAGMDIEEYYPLIESSLRFFEAHYEYLALQRGEDVLDDKGKMNFYPGSACETYKMAKNAASTLAALQVLSEAFVQENISENSKAHWQAFREKLPELPLRKQNGKMMLAPAESWERINNTEAPQLYSVWPWRIYRNDSPEAEKTLALNTYLYDDDVQQFRSYVGWKQYNIFAACLGLTDDAKHLTLLKFADSQHRFPTFWGPGFDWTPDHNWGGSAMIGLQEMLLQEKWDGSFAICPAWPAEWDVQFNLHAPAQTIVQAEWRDGQLQSITKTKKK